jgi:hypothetical protein
VGDHDTQPADSTTPPTTGRTTPLAIPLGDLRAPLGTPPEGCCAVRQFPLAGFVGGGPDRASFTRCPTAVGSVVISLRRSTDYDRGSTLIDLTSPIASSPLKTTDDEHPEVAYATDLGTMYRGNVEAFLASDVAIAVRDEVQMVFTSPPFPLNRKKSYGNLTGDRYLDWLGELARPLGDLLAEDGSIVVELGNAWEQGEPVMSTLALKALLRLLESGGFRLCQQFVVHNPARLPSPTQWVNVERIRVKDAYTHVWWMSRTERPKADNRRVLAEYSASMKKLLQRQSYNAGARPSQHKIGERSFLEDHGGAIPSNVLTISNTDSNTLYRSYCMDAGLPMHPARMAPALAEFFIRFLTDDGDLVLDPFAGSNTTGAAAEALGRRWLSVEPQAEYIAGSVGRFTDSPIEVAA